MSALDRYDDPNRTPGVVIAAVAAATVVVPFLVVYSFLFIARGVFVTPEQPDITGSRHGEAIAGFIALLFLAFVLWGMARMLNGYNRTVFWAGQLITAGTAGYLLLDASSGQPQVPIVVFLGAVLALALSITPPANRWVREPVDGGAGSAAGQPGWGPEGVEQPEAAAPVAQQG
ncbi:MAG TPA: hypothetical protein VHO01_11535 [Jatrophihabitans sp.]|nr:hypothetical protein [Jatrophihabitans sp.]